MHNTSCSLSLTELLFYRDMPSGSGKEDGIEKRCDSNIQWTHSHYKKAHLNPWLR